LSSRHVFHDSPRGLYIKNPGPLVLASKKGYGRIEIETTFDEKNQELKAPARFSQKSQRNDRGNSHLSPENAETAWDYMTAPQTGGQGGA